MAATVLRTTRARTAAQVGIPWVGDGWAAYADALWAQYTDAVAVTGGRRGWRVLRLAPGVALTQAVKHRRGRRLTRVEVQATVGPPVAQPYTVHIERLNGVLRDRLACLTRKTHAFAKREATWDAAVGLLVFEHNWLRCHPALRRPLAEPVAGRRYERRTPAMALGLATAPLSWLNFLTHPVSHYL